MDHGALPPPFLIGQTYCDRQGEYTVIAAHEDRLTIERADGRRTVENAALKARIHRNVVAERDVVLRDADRPRQRKRHEPTGRRKPLINRILLPEADGPA